MIFQVRMPFHVGHGFLKHLMRGLTKTGSSAAVLQTWYKLKDIEVQKDFALTLQKEYPHVMSM